MVLWHVTITLGSWPRLRQDQGDWFENEVEPWYFQGRWKYIFTQWKCMELELWTPKTLKLHFLSTSGGSFGALKIHFHTKCKCMELELCTPKTLKLLSLSLGVVDLWSGWNLLKWKKFLACYKHLVNNNKVVSSHLIFIYFCISWITI